jgi:hypothetical protein
MKLKNMQVQNEICRGFNGEKNFNEKTNPFVGLPLEKKLHIVIGFGHNILAQT